MSDRQPEDRPVPAVLPMGVHALVERPSSDAAARNAAISMVHG